METYKQGDLRQASPAAFGGLVAAPPAPARPLDIPPIQGNAVGTKNPQESQMERHPAFISDAFNGQNAATIMTSYQTPEETSNFPMAPQESYPSPFNGQNTGTFTRRYQTMVENYIQEAPLESRMERHPSSYHPDWLMALKKTLIPYYTPQRGQSFNSALDMPGPRGGVDRYIPDPVMGFPKLMLETVPNHVQYGHGGYCNETHPSTAHNCARNSRSFHHRGNYPYPPPPPALGQLHAGQGFSRPLVNGMLPGSIMPGSMTSQNQLLHNNHHFAPGSVPRAPMPGTMTSERQDPQIERLRADMGVKPCNCKKSRCLQLYCECFLANVACGSSCGCMDCHNHGGHEAEIEAARKAIMSRNNQAFEPKIVPADEAESGYSNTGSASKHRKGCNCSKSKCRLNYCECLKGGAGCSDACNCQGCENPKGAKRDNLKLGGSDNKEKQIEELAHSTPSINFET